MAEPWVTVTIGPALSLLERMSKKAANLRPVLDGPVANSIHEFFEKRFATEGAHGGTKWAPLAQKTLEWRAEHNRSGMPLLQFTRELWSSLVKRSSPLGYRVADDDSLLMGSSLPRAEEHQMGTQRMPARPIVPDEMPEADRDEWARLILQHVEAA